jgi:hypothetical protein
MKTSSVFEWYKRFKEGRKNLRDVERSGHPEVFTEPMDMMKNEESGAF